VDQVQRYVGPSFHLDTNRINARRKLRYMNQLEAWHANDVIELELSAVAQAEIARTKRPEHVRKASRYLATETLADTPGERRDLAVIAAILFPEGIRSSADANDVAIVFNAKKYCCILLTADGMSRTSVDTQNRPLMYS
jgi:hypothetical protein